MANYYNKTRTPIAVSLLRGGSVMLSPKSWTTIAMEDEGSESLLGCVRRGFVTVSRPAAPVDIPVSEAVSVAKVQEPTPVVAVPAIAAIAVESRPTMQEVAPLKPNRKGR
jgi:hypothetical protein